MERIVLSAATLVTVIGWRHAEPHPTLASTVAWHSVDNQRALDLQARQELDRHNLIAGHRLDPNFDDILGAIVRADRELYGWVHTTSCEWPEHFSVFAGYAHEQGFLLIRDHTTDLLTLQPVPVDELLDAFLAQLPPARPATGSTVTNPYESYRMATAPPPREGFTGFHRRPDSKVRALQRILRQPRVGDGNLYVATRDRARIRRRITYPVNYIDTRHGRWLTNLATQNGHLTITATPATTVLIGEHLDTRLALARPIGGRKAFVNGC